MLSGNAPPGAPRAAGAVLSDPGFNYVIYLTAPPPPNPRFIGGQSSDLTALAPRAPARAVDYTWLRSLPIHLIGQDAMVAGDQFFDLPPRAPARLRDYTWVYTLPGQFPPPAPTLPPGTQYNAAEPRASARVRADYPNLTRGSLALLGAPSTLTEQFQVVLFI